MQVEVWQVDTLRVLEQVRKELLSLGFSWPYSLRSCNLATLSDAEAKYLIDQLVEVLESYEQDGAKDQFSPVVTGA